jgi:aminoglycoside phosphotransferase (APT) family kinase protein
VVTDALDPQALSARATAAAQQWAAGCAVEDVTFLPGGTVSVVYTANVRGGRDGIERIVLKVAPPGLEPVRNRDVLRQARCIDALSRLPGIAVPKILFTDGGDPPQTPPFFVTPFLTGECVEPLLVAPSKPVGPDIAHARAFAAVSVLVAIHSPSTEELRLGDEPVMTPADEVHRWVRTLETVPDDLREGYRRAAKALLASAPDLIGPTVVHGDYRLGNMLCDGTTITGVIDWELWTVSDPRIDLSWMLFFTDEADHPSARHGIASGMPPRAQLLAAYESAIGRATEDLDWFDALTCFKEGAAMALIAKLARRRSAGGPDLFPASICTDLIARAASMVGA